MSTNYVSPLSDGLQQLYNDGLLNSNLSNTTLNHASSSQLNQLASTAISSQQTGPLLGTNTDSVFLSPTAINYLATNSNTDPTGPLTAAFENALLAPGTSAANKYLPQQSSTTGGTINVVG